MLFMLLSHSQARTMTAATRSSSGSSVNPTDVTDQELSNMLANFIQVTNATITQLLSRVQALEGAQANHAGTNMRAHSDDDAPGQYYTALEPFPRPEHTGKRSAVQSVPSTLCKFTQLLMRVLWNCTSSITGRSHLTAPLLSLFA